MALITIGLRKVAFVNAMKFGSKIYEQERENLEKGGIQGKIAKDAHKEQERPKTIGAMSTKKKPT